MPPTQLRFVSSLFLVSLAVCVPCRADWTVASGDWNADGIDSVRVIDTATGVGVPLEAFDGSALIAEERIERCHAVTWPDRRLRTIRVLVADLARSTLIEVADTPDECRGQTRLNVLVGDWDGDGTESVATFDFSRLTFFDGGAVCDPDPVSWLYGPDPQPWSPESEVTGPDPQPWVSGPDPQPWSPSRWALVGRLVSSADGVVTASSPGSIHRQCYVPVVGDWNGDGADSIALYLPESTELLDPEVQSVAGLQGPPTVEPGCFSWLEESKPVIVSDPASGAVLDHVKTSVLHECCWSPEGFDCHRILSH